jgi:hypothetical protein
MHRATSPLDRSVTSNEFTGPSVRSFIQERARAMAIGNTSLAAASRFACAEGFQAMPFRGDALVGVQGKCSVLGTSERASAVSRPSGKALPRSVMSICRDRSTTGSTCRPTRSRSLSSRSGDVSCPCDGGQQYVTRRRIGLSRRLPDDALSSRRSGPDGEAGLSRSGMTITQYCKIPNAALRLSNLLIVFKSTIQTVQNVLDLYRQEKRRQRDSETRDH